MTRSIRLAMVILILLFVVITGCAQVPREAGFGDVQKLVHKRADYRLHWNQGLATDEQVAQAVADLLEKELSLDAAVQIALLNNQHLQAIYEDLGITQADVVEAGLLENPIFFGQARFPDKSPSLTNLEFEVSQNFLNILMLPARKKLAAMQFEEVKLKVAEEVIKLAAEVREAFYRTVGASQINQLRQKIVEAAEASYEMARRMHTAGNLSELHLANEQAYYEQARVVHAVSMTTVVESREQLVRLMGLWGAQTEFKVPFQLPDVPPQEIALEQLESLAIENRMDLAAARQELQVLAQALGITLDWRWFAKADVGISTERDTDGQWVTGPSLSVELPLFNQRQADIARLEARLRRSQKRLAAQAVSIRAEVRTLRNRLMMQRHIAGHYKEVLIPLKERIVNLTLQNYNFMLNGALDLLIAKQNEIENYQKYIETVRDYWITQAQIQRVVGGRLPPLDQMDTEGHPPGQSKVSEDDSSDHFTESSSDSKSKVNILGMQEDR